MIEYYYGNPDALASVESMVLEDQVTELVLSKASVKEEKLPYEKAIQPDPEPTSKKSKPAKRKAGVTKESKVDDKAKPAAKAKTKTRAKPKSKPKPKK